jgi:hypothetical protein
VKRRRTPFSKNTTWYNIIVDLNRPIKAINLPDENETSPQ